MAHIFTADLHFGHANIIDYCARPFSSVEEMDQFQLSALQRHVGPADDLWILGDVAFAKGRLQKDRAKAIIEKIPGRKHLISGNHDHSWLSREVQWESQEKMQEIRVGDQWLVLCHYPLMTWNRRRYGAIHLFGHVHDACKGYRQAVNAGVDWWDYRPARLDEVVARANACEEMNFPPEAE
ncbi:calcineurin-like phosphoesterase family protein [Limimaricola soesokkakensis]|uniref:Calcineurin-like phosphoesterase family protein n=1 Tax=Limimaricola soesokkakensis TaxID=1343159 RepID=A0A1X6ZSD9_9RHOB|nr:metallophosphoesterase [Limimaricola soesokkakensis]PSK84060.1 calcineurin-like phosphoesterase family protein [Limimaricola soesokkakensis]SLN59664.1 hypothetical protein LOS8367_02865 [Limimaricola soesokkakensis]